jgi:hypothetical protein
MTETTADTPHYFEQHPVRADAGTTIGQVVDSPLENFHVPADRSQLMRRKQASQRSANDQRPPLHWASLAKRGYETTSSLHTPHRFGVDVPEDGFGSSSDGFNGAIRTFTARTSHAAAASCDGTLAGQAPGLNCRRRPKDLRARHGDAQDGLNGKVDGAEVQGRDLFGRSDL